MRLLLTESDCDRALSMVPQFLDGNLSREQSGWLHGHVKSCTGCAAVVAQFAEIDSALIGLGRSLGQRNPPPANARNELAARLEPGSQTPRVIRLLPAALVAIAAAMVVAVNVPQNLSPTEVREQAPFVAIPYTPPLDPHENTVIVRQDIRVETLLAMGYGVSGDPDAIVAADVLVGEDGRAHAVRILAGSELIGEGD